MNWRELLQLRTQVPEGSEADGLASAQSDWDDPYAEQRRRAVELLGERYVLRSANVMHRQSAASSGARAMLGMRH
ncbi:MAG: hypothetical protein IPJ21_09480 [Sterolibacteriaceae bacterium]|nr:hypothetical protein [Sterolibacteriaceae bacterium]MBK9084095.1 hypothetical protein [Sterolibacteriaceae bacterium]